jgi:hypothetical protein
MSRTRRDPRPATPAPARVLSLLSLLCAAAGCGSRTGLLVTTGSRSDGPQSLDMAPLDSGVDGVEALDRGRTANERSAALLDARRRDRSSTSDSCIPFPSVQGAYSGSWSGTWGCPVPNPSSVVSGTMKLTLSHSSSASSYTVKGSMNGTLQGLPFTSSVTGATTCTTFAAVLPDIVVLGTIKGTGTLAGSLKLLSSSKVGITGTFSATDQAKACKMAGTFTASHQ